MDSQEEVVVSKHRRKSKKKRKQNSCEDRTVFTLPEREERSRVEEHSSVTSKRQPNDDDSIQDTRTVTNSQDYERPSIIPEEDSSDDDIIDRNVNTRIGYSPGGDLLIRCGTCGSLILENSLEEHASLHGVLMVCDRCDFSTSSKGEFKRHAREHEEVKVNKRTKIPCHFSDCGLVFPSMKNLWKHCKIKHTTKMRCPDCKKRFRGEGRLALQYLHAHFNACPKHGIDDRRKKCTYCEATFKDRAGLKSHIIRRHTKRFQYECGLCDVKFVHHSLMVKHEKRKRHQKKINQLREEHPSQNPQIPNIRIENDVSYLHKKKCDHYEYQLKRDARIGSCEMCGFICKSCGDVFETYNSAQQHRHTYYCENCGKSFLKKRFYKLHIQYHDPLCSFRCDECELAFEKSASFTHHMKQHGIIIKGSRGSGKSGKPSQQQSLSFPCSECGKVFSKKRYLYDHTKRVHKERKFACNHCPKMWPTKVDRDRHEISHDQIKCFECDVCGKNFVRKLDFDHHRWNQCDIFLCTICDIEFDSQGLLVDHLGKHKDESFANNNVACHLPAKPTLPHKRFTQQRHKESETRVIEAMDQQEIDENEQEVES